LGCHSSRHKKITWIKKGDKVKFIDYGGVVALIPVFDNPIEAMDGMLKGESSLTKVLL
jgi:hypothetical protein